MVSAGNLEIGGSIDSSNIERGLGRISAGMDNLVSKAVGVNSDFARMDQSVGRLVTGFVALEVAGTTMMFALARDSPALAGAMAELGIETMALKFALGDALAPAMNIVVDGFGRFVDIIENNRDTIQDFTVGVLTNATNVMEDLGRAWNAISSTTKTLGIDLALGGVFKNLTLPLIAAILAKWAGFTPLGRAATAGATAIAQAEGQGAEIGGAVGATAGMVGGVPFGPAGIAAGALIVGGLGAILGQFIEDIIKEHQSRNARDQVNQSFPDNI